MSILKINKWFLDKFIPDASAHLIGQGRQPFGILLIDNAPVHGVSMISPDQNWISIFLPPNTTAILQPCDQNIMYSTKQKYSSDMVNVINSHCLDEDIPMRECIAGIEFTDFASGVCRSWARVTAHEVKAAWRPVLFNHIGGKNP